MRIFALVSEQLDRVFLIDAKTQEDALCNFTFEVLTDEYVLSEFEKENAFLHRMNLPPLYSLQDFKGEIVNCVEILGELNFTEKDCVEVLSIEFME
jgi:hypothetical protein